MKAFSRIIIIFFFIASFLLVPSSFAAGENDPEDDASKPAPTITLPPADIKESPSPSSSDFYSGRFRPKDPSAFSLKKITDQVLPNVAKWMTSFLAALAVIFLIVAGFQYLFSEGDPEKATQASKTAFYVIIGVMLSMFAYALVYLFLTIFSS